LQNSNKYAKIKAGIDSLVGSNCDLNIYRILLPATLLRESKLNMKEKIKKVLSPFLDIDFICNLLHWSFTLTLYGTILSIVEVLDGRKSAISVSHTMSDAFILLFLFFIAFSLVVSTIKVIIESKRKKGEDKQ